MTIQKLENKNTHFHKHQELLNEILDGQPYCDFWSSKIRLLKHLKENPEDNNQQFLIELISFLLDSIAFDRDSENLKKTHS